MWWFGVFLRDFIEIFLCTCKAFGKIVGTWCSSSKAFGGGRGGGNWDYLVCLLLLICVLFGN